MNGTEILSLLERLNGTSSTNAKQVLVNQHILDPLFQAVCKWTLDPFITFGVTKWPTPAAPGREDITIGEDGILAPRWVQELLEGLSRRSLTGGAAQTAIQNTLGMLSPASAELLERILGRSLKCKVTKTIVNKALPGLVPTFDVMRAYEYEEKRVTEFPVYVEEKFDGVRLICFVDPSKKSVQFFSRSGIAFTNLEHLYPSMLELVERINEERQFRGEFVSKTWVFDGEALAGAFNKTVGDIRRQKEQAVDAIFHIFDAIPGSKWSDDVESAGHYYNRSTLLFNTMHGLNLHGIEMVESMPVYSHEEIQEAYQKVRDRGGEGIIVKLGHGSYQRKKSRNWLKIKAKETLDLVVTGQFEGEGKYVGMLGGFLCDHNGVEVKVGGGLTDAERATLWLEDNTNRMIEVEYHEETPDGSLRHPRFKGFRDDKHLPGDEL